jgi:hypothetical protein
MMPPYDAVLAATGLARSNWCLRTSSLSRHGLEPRLRAAPTKLAHSDRSPLVTTSATRCVFTATLRRCHSGAIGGIGVGTCRPSLINRLVRSVFTSANPLTGYRRTNPAAVAVTDLVTLVAITSKNSRASGNQSFARRAPRVVFVRAWPGTLHRSPVVAAIWHVALISILAVHLSIVDMTKAALARGHDQTHSASRPSLHERARHW